MSWLDKVKTDYVIKIVADVSDDPEGDRYVVKSFMPLWFNATKHKDYTLAEYNYKNVQGSQVKRGNAKGTQYNIEIAFQGEDHLSEAEQFEAASDYVDTRTGFAPPWVIVHPFYGRIAVQPVSLTFDNSQGNASYITGLVIQTNEDPVFASLKSDPATLIEAEGATVNQGFTRTYAAEVPSPKVSDIQAIRNNINNSYKQVSSLMNGLQSDVDSYMNIYNEANALVNNAAYDTMQLLYQTQKLLGTPAYFIDTLNNRLNMFIVQQELLNRQIDTILKIPSKTAKSLKILYENNAGTTIIGMCVATMQNITNEYNYKPAVLTVISQILQSWNAYLDNLMLLQTPNGGQEDSYIPNGTNILQLQQLVNNTTSALFAIATRAKQQRTMTLPYDTNMILLANQLYGMRQDDSTIQQLIDNNNIGENEYLLMKQGRQIIYYV